MKLYGLYSEKQKCLMAVDVSANDGEFCTSVEVSLFKFFDGDTLWVGTEAEANNVCEKGSTEWYNACFKSPSWPEDYYGDLKSVCLNDFS